MSRSPASIRDHRGRYVMLAVSDNGMGMDEATRSRIFDRFLHQGNLKGSGLGLANGLRHRQAERRTRLGLQRTGRGTTFKIYLVVTQDRHSPKLMQNFPRRRA
jgi:signal transduction histidine kinase